MVKLKVSSINRYITVIPHNDFMGRINNKFDVNGKPDKVWQPKWRINKGVEEWPSFSRGFPTLKILCELMIGHLMEKRPAPIYDTHNCYITAEDIQTECPASMWTFVWRKKK